MRWWGASFMVGAAGCVVLPDPLGRFLLAVLIGVAVIALAVDWHEKQEQVRQAPALVKDRQYIAEIKTLTEVDAELDDEWREFLGPVPVEGRPLTESTLPNRLRKVSGRVPQQRNGGRA